MALTTYRSLVPITTAARRLEAYERIGVLVAHLPRLGPNLLRIQLMTPSLFIEVDVTDPLPAEQLDHLGLQGPI